MKCQDKNKMYMQTQSVIQIQGESLL